MTASASSATVEGSGTAAGPVRRNSCPLLAEKTGLNRVTLARLELAMHPPNLETLERIARALRVSLADLVK